MRKLFTHIAAIHGIENNPQPMLKGEEMAHVNSLKNAWLLIEDGKFAGWGTMDLDPLPTADDSVSLTGLEILPGLVDSHTHCIFAEPRSAEWEMRLKGATYEEIAAAGGGILNSAAKLRSMDEEWLYEQSLWRVQRMIEHGSTTIEIKSGYGLSTESELKMLRIARRIGQNVNATIKTTFLGAHAVPPEFKGRQDDYVEHILNEMLPEVCGEGLADHMDVFCDRGFFTAEQTLRLLESAAKLGLPAKIHANELGITGGVQVAASAGAWSADHLEHIGDEEIECLRNSEVMPVGLPGTSYFLDIPYTPAREIIGAGLPFALASDFNPGSSPVCSLQMVWSLGCSRMKMLPAEAFNAISLNAARSLRLENTTGSIAVGKQADFWTTETRNALQSVPYFFGVNHAKDVYLKGTKN
ncbi:MAG: imidazolonepropionase [Sphingomonadales bacterium]